jgi:hypothetical protein
VNRYFAAPRDWVPAPDSATKVIARLRNKAPLAVEHKFGEGRVVAVLTKASPLETSLGSWNNWGQGNPSFVVAVLELQSYLAAPRHPDTSRLVGTPLEVPVDVSKVLPQVRFVMPSPAGGGTLAVDAQTSSNGHSAILADTDSSGIYQAQLTRTDGTQQIERFALNVTPEEGDLAKLDSSHLASQLEGLRYEYHDARDSDFNSQQLAGFNLSETLLWALVALLVCEQVLAYVCSYHPAAKGARG